MPLNYKKWDALELSDDSDIEGHPNVDKKSLIRWKQRDIHEKREVRNTNIVRLHAQIAAHEVILDRMRTLSAELSAATSSDVPGIYSARVERLEKQPSPEKAENMAQSYDEIMLEVLRMASKDAKTKSADKGAEELGPLLVKEVQGHVEQITKKLGEWRTELQSEEKERAKKITTDDIHEGFDSKYVPAKPAPPPVTKPKKKTTTTTTEFETLNPGKAASSSSSPSTSTTSTTAVGEDDDLDELPEMTPSLQQFARIPVGAYQKSFEFIQNHRDVYVPGAWDALLVEAFNAQSRGELVHARQCIHQSLLLQYCSKLGPDGVGLFFRKILTGDKRAEGVFVKDFQDTYAHLAQRVEISKKEEAAAGSGEQIQLVPENPDQTIGFNVPDGPPPEHIQLEGPGTENMNLEDVRHALQVRWDIFSEFSDEMKDALRGGKLQEVNKVLGAMTVEDAEHVVELLDVGGILNFASGGIRDETGKGQENVAGDDEAAEVE